MTQGTLSFASAKRTNSAVRTKKTAAITRSSSAAEKEKINPTERPVRTEIVHEISSGEEDTPAVETTLPTKRTRASTKAQLSSSTTKKSLISRSESTSAPAEVERKSLDVVDKAGRYRRYYKEVREKMGGMEPVHSGGQNMIHQMLRFFDMSYEFGPCVGMTRLERWERAEAFGLNPPVEVRDMLLTKEGIEKDEYSQCVFYGEV